MMAGESHRVILARFESELVWFPRQRKRTAPGGDYGNEQQYVKRNVPLVRLNELLRKP